MSASPSTVAIIVTFNRKDSLLRCLAAQRAQWPPCDSLIIDNGSSDGTEEAVVPFLDSRTIYVNTGTNLGGAGGFARGIEEAVRRGYEHVWIMDDDVIPEPDALKKLQEADAALGGNYGWLSSRCVLPDGSPCPMNIQRRTPFSKLSPEALSSSSGNPVPAQMASFVSLFFRAETVRRFGLPIAEFFIWSDDLEWTRRVSRERPCYIIPMSTVVHAITGSAASNVAIDTTERIPRYFYAFRNEFCVYRREGLRGLAYYFAKVALNLARILVQADGHHLLRLWTLCRGVFAGLAFKARIRT